MDRRRVGRIRPVIPDSVLRRLVTVSVALFVGNVVWAGILDSTSGRIVATFGALVSLVPLVALYASQRIRTAVLASPPEFAAQRRRMLAVLAPFLLPLPFLHTAPVIAFWRFDGRSALLAAWVISIVVALSFEREQPESPNQPGRRYLLTLFLLFSAGVWLAIVMDSGVAAFMMEVDRRGPRPCQSDPFTTMATVWQANPASQHLFLAWRSEADFNDRIVYANHVHPFLLSVYGWMRAAQTLGHLTLWQASNTTILLPIFVLIVAFAALVARSGSLWSRRSAGQLFALFMAVGILLTTWRLWLDLVRFNSDNPFPLLAGLLILLYALMLPPVRTRSAAAAAALFAALSPTNTPMVILPVICLFGQRGQNARDLIRQNRAVLLICLTALIAGAVSYLEPRFLIRSNGFHPQESSLLFRSGLDGDTRYFSGLLQAVVAPCPLGCCYARSLSDLLMPAAIPLAVFGLVLWRSAPSQIVVIGRLLLFLTTPYLLSVILFPQSVSIHPYIYDHWFIIPVVVSGLMAMLSPLIGDRLRGAGWLGFLLSGGAIVMSNLLGIAQGLARAIAFFKS